MIFGLTLSMILMAIVTHIATDVHGVKGNQIDEEFEREFEQEYEQEIEFMDAEIKKEEEINETFDAWNKEDEAGSEVLENEDSSSSKTIFMLGIVGAAGGVVAIAFYVKLVQDNKKIVQRNHLAGNPSETMLTM